MSSLTNAQLDQLARSRLLVLDATREGVYRIDQDGRCIFMNLSAGRMLGYGIGEALGKNMHALHHPCRPEHAELPAGRCPIHEFSGTTLPCSSDNEVFRRVNGSLFAVECSSCPLFEDDEYRGAVITFRDITERRRVERSLRMKLSVNRLLDSATSIEQVLPQILRRICEDLELGWSAVWLADSSDEAPRFVASWPEGSPLHEQLLRFSGLSIAADTNELPNRVWRSGRTEWISDLRHEAQISARASAAVAARLHSGLAMPIWGGQNRHGVIEFFGDEVAPPDQSLVDVLGMVGNAVGRFIERIRTQTEKARLAAILDVATDFVGIVADETGVILTVNRAVETMLGYSPAEILGRPLSILIPEYKRRLRDDGWPEKASCKILHSARFRTYGCHENGVLKPLEVSFGECIENGARLLTLIITDITERRAAEETLERQAEELLRSEEALRSQTRVVQSIVASMGDGVIVADQNSDLLLVNPAAANLVPDSVNHVLPEDQTNTDIGVFLPDGVTRYPVDQQPLALAIRGESTNGAELFVRSHERPTGFWLSQTARPLMDEDGVLRGGVVIVRDITEQKISEEALRHAKEDAESANRAKSDFLSRMSHELRTPMNAILGFAQLLELDPLTPEQRDGTSRILKAGRHLLGLINEILDIARIEAGRLNVEVEPVCPIDIVQAAAELVRPLLAQRNIKLIWPVMTKRGWYLLADRQRLTQVFLNLLSNAVKYNRENGSVAVGFEETSQGKLRIQITDTGAGIAPADISKLFVPFERLGADRTAIEGTGLGLALAQRFMVTMGGSIGVESQVGGGSTFWVEMPLHNLEELREHSGVNCTTSTMMAADCMSRGAILYIEDNLENLNLIEAILARVPGFQLLSSGRGDLGLELARQHRPNLILLDLRLPDMHGIEVLRQLRQQEETLHIPVVVVSADATAKTRQDLLDEGAHSYLNKPIDVREFLDVVTGFF